MPVKKGTKLGSRKAKKELVGAPMVPSEDGRPVGIGLNSLEDGPSDEGPLAFSGLRDDGGVMHHGPLKGEEPPSPAYLDKRKRLDALMDRTNKRLGGAARIMRASEVQQPFHVRRPTGIPDLDIAMAGGFPAGTLCQVFGKAGACKNYLVDRVIANTQRIYGEGAAIAFATAGYGYDKLYGHSNGAAVPMGDDEIEILRQQRGGNLSREEEARRRLRIGEFFEIALGSTEEALEQPLESVLSTVVDLIASAEFQLVIFDEANIGQTKAEAKKDFDKDPKQAALASLMARFVSKFYTAIKSRDALGKPNETTVMLILEARAQVGGFNPTGQEQLTQTGGHALKHAKAMDIQLRAGQHIRDSRQNKVGKEIHWEILKAKLGSHEGAKGQFSFHFNHGADIEAVLVSTAVDCGVIRNSGAWYYYKDERLAQGVDNVAVKFRDNPALAEEIHRMCLQASGLNPIYR